MRALFVDQGRAMAGSAMGHVRVRHALRAGMAELDEPIEVDEIVVPPFTRAERRAVRYVPGLESGGFGSLRWHLARSWVARRMIGHYVERRRPDVVHLTTAQVALLLGDLQDEIPCIPSLDVLTVDWAGMRRGIRADTPRPSYLKPLAALERRALERAPLSIAWTDTVASSIRRLAPQAEVAVLHPGIDLRLHRPPPGRRSGGRLRILFVGGRWEAKGGSDLLAALGPHLGESVHLDVVTTAQLAPTEGVTLHRARPGSNLVADLFAAADVFCLPTYVDAVPWVVLEAMATGTPVISTRIGSIPELLGDTGILIEPGDRQALGEALGTLIEDGARRRSMGEAARGRAEQRYDALANTGELVDLLRGVAARHPDGR